VCLEGGGGGGSSSLFFFFFFSGVVGRGGVGVCVDLCVCGCLGWGG